MGKKKAKNKKQRNAEKQQQNVIVVKASSLDSASLSVENAAYWAFASAASADEIANPEARRLLRSRCRYEYLNDGFAQNAARTLAIAVTGTGPRLQVHADRETADKIENAFHAWATSIRLAEKLDLAVRSLVFDGETFFRFVQDKRIPDGFNIELVDAGRVTSKTYGIALDENELDGIRFDEQGNPASYTIARQPVNPMYSGIPVAFETVPAAQILHLFIPDLPGQHRGLPLLQSSLQTLGALRRYNAAVIEAAETAASMSLLIQTQHLPEGDEPANAAPMKEIDVPRKGGMFLPRGWVANQMKPEQPTTQHAEFIAATLTGIGAGVGQPRNIISNDSSDYNYASGRLDHQTFFRYVETIQQRLTHLLDAILDFFLETTNRSEVADIDVEAQEREWYFAQLEHVDPPKEADAVVKLNEAGFLTKSEYYAKYGQDWERQADQWNTEKKRFGNTGGNRWPINYRSTISLSKRAAWAGFLRST